MLDKFTQLSHPLVSISSNIFLSQQPLRVSIDFGLAIEDSFSSKFNDFDPKNVFWMSLKLKNRRLENCCKMKTCYTLVRCYTYLIELLTLISGSLLN